MKYSLLFFLFIGILSCTSCGDKECDFPGAYEFVLPVTLYPTQDTFHIGDTIMVSSFFSDMVYDQKTKKKYHLVDFNFYPSTNLFRIDTTLAQFHSFNEFSVIIDTANFDYHFFNYSDGNRTLTGQYTYKNGNYSLQYKLILLKKGLFLHLLGLSIIDFDEFQEFEGRCKNKASSAVARLNDEKNSNVDFLLASPEEKYHKIWKKKETKFFNGAGYCFYVE